MSNIDYDTRYAKHCVRYHGWLPASKAYQEQIGRKPLKYFTLCAKQAIDVFMLELEGVLLRDDNRKLPNVIICEKEPKDAADIFKLVRPPLREAILVGELEEILTFQDTPETRSLSPDEDVRDRRIRKLLRTKRLHELAKEYFPFDIINFDPYGNLLNPAQEDNKLYHALYKIFELQAQTTIRRFLLFVTTPIYDVHPESQARLETDFESNVSSYPRIRDALESSLHTIHYHEIYEEKRIAIGFAKSIVISAAKGNGWNHRHHGIFVYQTPSRNKMLSSVVEFSKADGPSDESVSVPDIIRIIEQMPAYYSYEYSLENQDVIGHLEAIKQYRETVRNEFRQEP